MEIIVLGKDRLVVEKFGRVLMATEIVFSDLVVVYCRFCHSGKVCSGDYLIGYQQQSKKLLANYLIDEGKWLKQFTLMSQLVTLVTISYHLKY